MTLRMYVISSVVVCALCCLTVASGLRYSIDEEDAPGLVIGNIPTDSGLRDKHSPEVLSRLRYSILNNENSDNAKDLFIVTETTGVVRTRVRLDREQICLQELACLVKFQVGVTPSEYFEIIDIEVDIKDINDHSPEFSLNEVKLEISEMSSVGLRRTLPLAQDADSGHLSVDSYALIPENNKFVLESLPLPNNLLSLNLKLQERLDREETSFYRMKLVAYDGGVPRRTGAVEVMITVLDGNDNNPAFDNSTYSVQVEENVRINTTIVTVRAHDPDEGIHGEIEYAFATTTPAQSEMFDINKKTGQIWVKGQLDHEKQPRYELLVSAQDKGPNSQPSFTTVVVEVKDLNDNPPRITVSALSQSGVPSVAEHKGTNSAVAFISVSDPDTGPNGQFTCQLDNPQFELEEIQMSQYKLNTAAVFDREDTPEVLVSISCQDLGNPSLQSSKLVTVSVQDENDNGPRFSNELYRVEIAENNALGSAILQVNATDLDEGDNGRTSYSLTGQMADLFVVNPDTGVIQSRIVLDYESTREFMFQVIAVDNGVSPKSATATVLITVLDANDEPPRFQKPHYKMEVKENQPIGMEIGKVSASDLDSTPFDYIEYALAPSAAAQMFAVDTQTGILRTKSVLDREVMALYELTVLAINAGINPSLNGSTVVTIPVLDENDNNPKINFPSNANHTIHVPGNAYRGYDVGYVHASDPDEGANAELTFSISGGNNLFMIDPVTGMIRTMDDLSKYVDETVRVVVTVSDQGFPPLPSEAVLNIVVNQTLSHTSSAAGSRLIGGTNLTIVVALSISSIIVMVILVIAIIIVKRQSNKNKATGYRHRLEGIKVWNRNPAKTKQTVRVDREKQHKKEVSFSKDGDIEKNLSPAEGPSSYSSGQPHNNLNTLNNEAKMWDLSVKQLPNQPWYGDIPAEGDTASSSSGEVSNADSGKGASEEGENSVNTSLSGVYSVSGNIRRLPPQVTPHNAGKPSVGHNSNYSRPYPSSHQGVARIPGNNAQKVPEKHRTKGPSTGPPPHPSYGGYDSAKTGFGPPPRPSRHSSDKYGYCGNQGRLPVTKEHNNKSKMVPNVVDSRSDRWENGADPYGDEGSSTSGSYILDLKDLGDSVDQSTYNAVVV